MDERTKAARHIAGHTWPLSDEGISLLAGILEKTELGKGEFFFKEGDVADSMGLVTSGLVRQFYRKKKVEITEHFTYEGHLFVCLESFIRQTPTRIFVEALEPTVIYKVPYGPFHALMEQDIGILRLYCALLESSLVISQHKADARKQQTALERYRQLEREHPEIIRRAPQIHVASYLGMSPETLSRIRGVRD